MATHKVKTGQTGDNAPSDWKDKVVVRTETKEVESELTYSLVESQLNTEKQYLEIVTKNIEELEDKLEKIKAVADK
tara:strand:- start:1976 stop:2203 length:228 start_codon:yes stop_codon:yes gene_type:complete